MVQIVPAAKQKESFGSLFGRGLGQGVSQGFAQSIQNKQQEQSEERKFLHDILLQKAKKKQEDVGSFEQGLGTIQSMRDIISKKNVGRGSSFTGLFGGETARDRAELSQLGTSLIPLVAAGVPIRNQKEFEQYKKIITDPSSLISEMEGALDGLQRIFEAKIGGDLKSEGDDLVKDSKVMRSKKIKFNPKNKEHIDKRNQLMKKFNGDREKVSEILMQEFLE